MRPPSLSLGFFISLTLLLSPFFVVAHENGNQAHEEQHQIEALQAQISQLLATITSLQSQILAVSSGQMGTFGYTFTINDWGFRGYEGESYRWLQKALNRLGYTVAATGPGSVGSETAYFGSATEAALQKFQRDNNIVSSGSPQTTGYGALGPSTRAKLNELLAQKTTTTTQNTQNTTETTKEQTPSNASGQAIEPGGSGQTTNIDSSLSSGSVGLGLSTSESGDDTFRVGAFSTYEAPAGNSITVNGNMLTNNTKVLFGDTEVAGVANQTGTSFTFTVPNITPGYYVPVFEKNGVEATRRADFVITNPNAEPPELYTISPSIGAVGITITLRGKGFTPTRNTVNFGFDVGLIEGLSSPDGETLTFTLDSNTLPNDFLLESSGNGTNEFPLTLRVINANGMSEDTIRFIIRM